MLFVSRTYANFNLPNIDGKNKLKNKINIKLRPVKTMCAGSIF